MRPALGGRLAATIRSGTGRGGVTGSRFSCVLALWLCRYLRGALAVAIAGRASPSATQTLGSVCDCRFTKR